MSQSKQVNLNQSQSDVNNPAHANQLAIEAQIVRTLQDLAHKFHDYHVLYTNEQKTQCQLVEQLLVLSQRYSILLHSLEADCLTAIRIIEPFELLLVDFNNLYQQLLTSNKTLQDAAEALHENYTGFKKLQYQLNFVESTPFIGGDAHHKPLEYFIEFVDDVHIYISSRILKLRYYAETLELAHVQQLQIYKQLLVPNADFEERLIIGLAYCKCLKTSTKTNHMEPQQDDEEVLPLKRRVQLLSPTST